MCGWPQAPWSTVILSTAVGSPLFFLVCFSQHCDSSKAATDMSTKLHSFRNKMLMDQALSASSTNLYKMPVNQIDLDPFDFMLLTSEEGFHRGQPIVFRSNSLPSPARHIRALNVLYFIVTGA